MRLTIRGLTLLVPLLVAPGAMAQAQQGPGNRAPEGNLGSGAAMGSAQQQSTGGANAPSGPATSSPRPPGAPDTPARNRPEGNLGSGAAMGGAQQRSGSGGAAPSGPAPTSSPSPSGSGSTPAR